MPKDGPAVSPRMLGHEDLRQLRGLQSDTETRTETWLRNEVSAARPNTPDARDARRRARCRGHRAKGAGE